MDNSFNAIFWLKEFRKSWVHIISDEVVYGEQISEQESRWVIGISGKGGTYIKDYLSGNFWLEILLKLRRLGELELYTALIEADESVHKEKPLRARQASGDIKFSHTRQNNPMLINNIHPMENPKGMPSLLPIRSVIRLHRLDVIPSVFAKAFEPFGEIRTLLDEDRETSEFIMCSGERPCDVIKSGTQSMGNFTYQESPFGRICLPEIRVINIASIIRVFINGASVRLTCDEGGDFTFEGIQVFLCPIDSDDGGSHLLHMLYFPQGETNAREETTDSKGARDTRAQKERVSRQSTDR